jgi:hypothetical protein
MSEIITVGLDLATNVFQAHGADASGQAVQLDAEATGCSAMAIKVRYRAFRLTLGGTFASSPLCLSECLRGRVDARRAIQF